MNHTDSQLYRIANLAGPVSISMPGGKLMFKVFVEELAHLTDKDLLGPEDVGENLRTSFYEDSELGYHDKLTILKAFTAFAEDKGLDYVHEFDKDMVQDFPKWLDYFVKAYEEWVKIHNPLFKHNAVQMEVFSSDPFHHMWVGTIGDFGKTGIYWGEKEDAARFGILHMKALLSHIFETIPTKI